MSKYLFRSICPVCLDGDIIKWTHTKCGGTRYIDENLYLICEKCNDRTFILDTSFTCNHNNHNKAEKPDVLSLMEIISSFENIPDINGCTRRKMLDKLKQFR